MIQANELRIGNKVLSPHIKGSHATVEGILSGNKGIVVDGIITCENLEPIPLSPSILEACGFTIGSNQIWWRPNYLLSFRQTTEGFFTTIDHGENYPSSFGMAIKHLHQLQNIVAALTGTELTINLEKVKV